jgi:acetyltransferase-like isoleucine patch superfamily enzyme
MSDVVPGIRAETVTLGTGCAIDSGSRICAREVIIGTRVVIEPGVAIAADRLEIGDGCRIGRDVSIVCPDVRIGAGSRLGEGSTVELNEYLRFGRLCDVGRRMRVVGQGLGAGDYLWLTDDVRIGGGGARGPRSYLTIGDRSAVMDGCFINLAEPVTIGHNVALSNNVVLLTHSMWHPVLDGGTATFGPVTIGNQVILYVNAVVAPGVTLGDQVTVGAGALVLGDVPDGSTAIGNPARVMKLPGFPRQLDGDRREAIIRDLLREYGAALRTKAGGVAFDEATGTLNVNLDGSRETIRCVASGPEPPSAVPATITLSVGPVPAHAKGRVHFDLARAVLEGDTTPLVEDLRDFLRRRSIRVFTDHPFQSLPPANIARLRARLAND